MINISFATILYFEHLISLRLHFISRNISIEIRNLQHHSQHALPSQGQTAKGPVGSRRCSAPAPLTCAAAGPSSSVHDGPASRTRSKTKGTDLAQA